MKTLDLFVVELEKQINDTITTDGGLELYMDTRHEGSEFRNRVTEGPVVSAPLKHDTGVEEGDTLFFHHLIPSSRLLLLVRRGTLHQSGNAFLIYQPSYLQADSLFFFVILSCFTILFNHPFSRYPCPLQSAT